MNKLEYNSQNLNAYLLDSLTAEETGQFDELSFTDDNFADALDSAEKDLIDAYVRGELGGATLEKFKSYYLASPARRKKVEFAEAFQIYAEQNFSKKNVAAEEPKQTFAGFLASLNIFANRNPVLQWSFAAVALAFMVLGGLWIFKNRSGRELEIAKENAPAPTNQESPKSVKEIPSAVPEVEKEVAQANVENDLPPVNKNIKINKPPVVEPPRIPKQKEIPSLPKISIATFLLTPLLRGTNQIQSIAFPESTNGVKMRLQLESDDYPAYRVILKDPSSDKSIWQSQPLKLQGKGTGKTLNPIIPAKVLNPQIYSLQVSGISADGAVEIISDYPFRVLR